MSKIGAQVNILDEIIVDNFAGGGGASTGMELATGRPVEIAINHDPDAILMHKTNHPHTTHYQASVWDVDPVEVCMGRPVGLAWFSPDCKHFSKAKGAALVDRNIRGLAWIVLRWAAKVRPRVIILENVEEFQTWGPVRKGKPVKKNAGQTFRKWKGQLSELGYDIEHRELVAADFGAPTIRKRFFLVARCDGRPIVWPERTHAPADSEEVRSGKCKPWRAAHEIIDWSLPMYSVFESKKEIREKYGATVVRPLADNTMRRVIRGTDKFTIRSGKPFLVPTGYGERAGQAPRVHDIDAPLSTVVSTVKQNLCKPELAPFLAECNHSGEGHIAEADKPLGTVTAKCTKGVCSPLLSPVTVSNTSGSVGFPADKPIHTITTDGKQILHAAHLAQYHTEQTEAVRGQGLSSPLQTVDAANRYSLISANLVEYFSSGRPIDLTDPMHTVTTLPREALSAAHVVEFKGKDLGQSLTSPLRTITTSAGEFAVCKAVIAKAEAGNDFGHWPEIRELLNCYCDYHLASDEIILLVIDGVAFYIRDILLRMLTPRELYNAMGFPPDYIIDRDDTGKKYPRSEQVKRCGNSVCPPIPAALVKANLPELCVAERMPNLSADRVMEDEGHQMRFA